MREERRDEMRFSVFLATALLASAMFAEHQPFDRYQSIVDRQMFGRPPAGFDPTKPASMVQKGEEKEITREQEALRSAIHFSAINVTPDGATAVGFTDNSNGKQPMHYYLKVGEERDGWKVVEADPVKATMKVEKNDVEVSLSLGANSAKGGGTTSARGAGAPSAPGAMPQRPGLLGNRRQLPAGDGMGVNRMGSLRERRAARAAEAEKERAAREAEAEKEKAAREAEREAQRKELQLLKDELKAQRDAAEADRAAREAERAARENQAGQQSQVEANAENED